MTTRFLTIAMAIAMLFGAQHMVAKSSTKSSTKTTSTAKKHHKHHTKKASAASMPALTA